MYGHPQRRTVQRHRERLEMDQVARDAQQGRALRERLPDQAESELLEVSEPTVDELGGATAGAHRQVVALDQRRPQTARGGVQERPDTRDATTHDEHVELVATQGIDGGRPLREWLCGLVWWSWASHVDRLQGVVDASVSFVGVEVHSMVPLIGQVHLRQHPSSLRGRDRRIRIPADARRCQERSSERGRFRFGEALHDATRHVRLDATSRVGREHRHPGPGCGRRPGPARPARRRCPAARTRSPPARPDSGDVGRGPGAGRGRCPAPGHSSGV